ncbi:hypothetical protein QOZ80_8BG0664470 [Eleusine coracana subsp. coracana]|nr:hypothetical protein QOZ80_8BG0664470 [Eleusine coracana subsp. coracana]
MDQSRKRAREGEAAAGTTIRRQRQSTAEVAEALANGSGDVGEDEPWQRPPGVFELPWQKCRGGLGLASAGGGLELRDVFFRSLVDGRTAMIGVPGDRLFAAPSEGPTFDDVEAWFADAGDDEVDPLWWSVLEGPKPAA